MPSLPRLRRLRRLQLWLLHFVGSLPLHLLTASAFNVVDQRSLSWQGKLRCVSVRPALCEWTGKAATTPGRHIEGKLCLLLSTLWGRYSS